ncbi:MAG: 4-alpha-glucanotransferase [Planctomycetes bacterium]|nr:4-alpha-glucanotransferase [Planctomycetota bacterium]
MDTQSKLQPTRDATREALLTAIGFDVSTEAAARRCSDQWESRHRHRLVSPTQVVRNAPRYVHVSLSPSATRLPGRADWRLEVFTEDGDSRRLEGRVRAVGAGLRLPLSGELPPGCHSLILTLDAAGQVHIGEQTLIVVPPRCYTCDQGLQGRRGWGVWANLYSIASKRNWGVGDLSDLSAILRLSARAGAAFVGINPLHAVRNRPGEFCPYSPVSRLFRSIAYLDVEAVPELRHCPPARRLLREPDMRSILASLRASERVDYPQVAAIKLKVMRLLHRTFLERELRADTPRARAYRRYLAEQGEPLVDFATYMAFDEHFTARNSGPGLMPGDGPPLGYRAWPRASHDPRSPQVQEFRRTHWQSVDVQCYIQFELDRQLGKCARTARTAGMPLGVYGDLALGSAPGGSDAWTFASQFVPGVTVGAPPDAHAREGQNWSFHPVSPHALHDSGYALWRRLLKSACGHVGMLRIDHVLGLFRQFWIPAGRPASEGAYVRYPSEDLFGVVALQSARSRTVIVGEDLGTVPRGLSRVLARWGILSSRVLYFQRTRRGAFHPPSAYTHRALVTATTHDLPPLTGYWTGADLALRRKLGLLRSDLDYAAAVVARRQEVRALLRRLHAEGLLDAERVPVAPEVVQAVHAFLLRTPAVLVGLSLDDLAGETEPVNLPGVGLSRFAGWSRRMRQPATAHWFRELPRVRPAPLSRARERAARESEPQE